jgi:hypothetical protein
MIIKRMHPTSRSSFTIIEPNAATIAPESPVVKIALVVEIVTRRRDTTPRRRIAGRVEKCVGSETEKLPTRRKRASKIFEIIRPSSIADGSGTTALPMIRTSKKGTIIPFIGK